MEVQVQKKNEGETINKNESSKIRKKSVKRTKKKETKNYKGLKDLLNDISKNKEKENINIIEKEQNLDEIKNNTNQEKEIENISDQIANEISNNSKSNSSTRTSIISQEEIINDIYKLKIETEVEKTINTLPKIKRLNYILKKSDIIENESNKENNNNNSNNPSLMCYYYEGYEKYLQKRNETIINPNNSINFVEKKLISSEFNFNNDKFIINNYIKLIDNNNNNLINNNNIDVNLNFINGQSNNNNDDYNNNYSNNLNNNYLFYNNDDINKYDNNEPNIIGEEMINNENNTLNNVQNNDSNDLELLSNLNNYIIQNAFSYGNNNNNRKYKSKLLKKINFVEQNILSNLLELYPPTSNDINTNNNYLFNNKFNSNNFVYNSDNNINNKLLQNNKNEINHANNKKNTFTRRQNDWICKKCHNLNFAFRIFCNRCSAHKKLSVANNNNL